MLFRSIQKPMSHPGLTKYIKKNTKYFDQGVTGGWGDLKSYDLCIDSSILGIDGTVELIKQAVALKEKNL